jgi:AmmeMemoRadiSam system protein B
MKKGYPLVALFLLMISLPAFTQISKEELIKRVAIPATGGLRGLVDIIGFAHTPKQMDFVAAFCEREEKDHLAQFKEKYGISKDKPAIAVISPHDDYYYSGRVYVNAIPHIKAKRVIIFGVCHWAESFGVQDKLIFDTFRNWRGPYGPVTVSPLRREIIDRLDKEDYLIRNDIQGTEHSVEAIIPFLTHYNRKVEIVSILVPYMGWERMNELGGKLARAVGAIIKDNGWQPGSDIAFIISTDGVHYGDYGWSYYGYFPFGCDIKGYEQAVAQDHKLVNDYLTETLEQAKIKELFSLLVDENDPTKYRITWCGRFSVPFGTNFLAQLMRDLNHEPLKGYFLRYGTSISFPTLPVEKLNLGPTAPSNLHHFVSYIAVGYF